MAGPYTPPNLYDTPVPDLFSTIAQHNPDRPLAQVIREHPDGPADSIVFTWAETIQHAQNAAFDLLNGWTRSPKNGNNNKGLLAPRRPGSSPVVVGLLANNGYELYVNIIACLFNRWTPLLISPKNSPAAVEHLLRTSNSYILVLEPTNLKFGQEIEHTIPSICILSLAKLDAPGAGSSPSLITTYTREELKEEMAMPAFFLHTSGSTGHPKLVPWTHEFVLSGARGRVRDSREWIGIPLYSVPPIIHAAGMIMHFMYTPAHGHLINFVSSPISKPPTAASILTHLPFFKDGILIALPSILEDLYSMGPEAVKIVADETRLVSYTGAPLNRAIGDALVAGGMKLQTRYGSTEINFVSTHLSQRRSVDWEYIKFREGYNYHFLPVEESSDLKELIVGPGTDGCPAIINSDNPYGYVTNDVWEPHPTIPNFWRHHSRKGNVTVLSNGEKTDNKQIENLLLRDKRIRYVQVFGAGRPMNGVLIQRADPFIPTSQFLAQIGPTIETANLVLPTHSRIVPELVIVANADQPFSTSDKGTVKQKETLDKFSREVESAYERLEEGGSGDEWAFHGDVSKKENVKEYVRIAVYTVLGKTVPDNADLFEHGMDSLLIIRLRSAVISAVKKTRNSQQAVPRNVVYDLPSINALTNYLHSCSTATSDTRDANEERIRASIDKYSTNFVPHTPGARVVDGNIIALSGSTGSVGCSMLGLLLKMKNVQKIFLLNRSGKESQKTRQANGFKEKGIDPTLLDANKGTLIYLDVDFSRKDLGLSMEDYRNLQENVTHIIHVAWQLNFNWILESYERVHIAGVRHLIDLALSSPQARPPRLTFLSTIGAAVLYKGPSEEPSVGYTLGQPLVPEAPVDDPTITLDQGYSQAKYVSERILVRAADIGLRTTIVRVAQLSGTSSNGAWARNEYVPILFRSSLALGLAPDNLPPFRWIPSDIAASALLKQAFDDTSRLQYFAIDNPFPTQWSTVVHAMSAMSPRPLRFVPLSEWLEHIKRAEPDPKKIPAVKLLDFYKGRFDHPLVSAAMGWNNSVKLAPELAMGPISRNLVEKYIFYQQQQEALRDRRTYKL